MTRATRTKQEQRMGVDGTLLHLPSVALQSRLLISCFQFDVPDPFPGRLPTR